MKNLWTQAKEDFVPDGALRDILVLDTSESDWDQFLQLVKIQATGLQFSVDGKEQPVPEFASPFLAKERDASPLLSFRIEEVLFTCHFFTDTEIECSFAPNDISSEMKFVAVTEFMKSLGGTLGKEVILTQENCIENPILRYEVNDGCVEFLPDKSRAR